MEEHFFQCPHCWEEISMLLDPSAANETYIEDCEVCCNPIQINTIFENQILINLTIQSVEQ